jgi:orotate phosphoribosyltransferase
MKWSGGSTCVPVWSAKVSSETFAVSPFEMRRSGSNRGPGSPVYAERPDGGVGREFRRGFRLAPGERVLVVDDIITTGGSVDETIAAVRRAGARVVAAAVLVDRSGGAAEIDVPLHSLWRLDIPTYDPGHCPLCAARIPTDHPGTTPAPTAVR